MVIIINHIVTIINHIVTIHYDQMGDTPDH